jgi:hypothetical protein
MSPRVALVVALAACGNDATAAEQEPRPRRAEEFHSIEVEAVLEAVEHTVRTRGFSADGDEWRGFLVDQASAVSDAPMHGGSCYLVIGTATEALEELDLRLFDSDGSEVAQDSQRGGGAALLYCPPHSGTYYVAALATEGSGLFGVRRFVGPTGLDVRLDDLFAERPPAVPVERP